MIPSRTSESGGMATASESDSGAPSSAKRRAGQVRHRSAAGSSIELMSSSEASDKYNPKMDIPPSGGIGDEVIPPAAAIVDKKAEINTALLPTTAGTRQRETVHSNTVVRVLITIWIGTASLLSFILILLLQVLCWILLWPLFLWKPIWRYQVLGWLFHSLASLASVYLNPFWKMVIVRPLPEDYKVAGSIVIFNHSSGLDPWIAAAALFPHEFKFVYKKNLQKVPIAGWALRLSEDLALDFTREKGGWGTAPGSVATVMKKASWLLENGIGQAIFPEGTRSRSGRLQLFKLGFFRLAIERNAEIVPCVLHNVPSLWPLGSYLLNSGTVYVMFGNPTRPKHGETPEELSSRIRAEMISLYKESPLYDEELDAPLNELPAVRGLGIAGATTTYGQ